MSKFYVTDETGKEREATLIVSFSYNSDNYSMYSINRDNENVNIFVSKLINNPNSSKLLVDIYDKDKKAEIDLIIRDFIKGLKREALKLKRIDILDDVDFSGSTGLVFTTYKAYAFSIKKDLFDKIIKVYNSPLEIDADSSLQKKDDNDDYIKLEDESLNLMSNISQKVNEDKGILVEINEKEASETEDVIKKITLEKLDINDTESLKKMFNDSKIEKPETSKGYISEFLLVLIGVSAFITTLLFLVLQLQ